MLVDKPKLYVMFDKTLNPSPGWEQGKALAPDVTEGWWDWYETVRQHFELVIFSSHFATPGNRMKTLEWLRQSWKRWLKERQRADAPMPYIKLDTNIYDPWRIIGASTERFEGSWSDSRLSASALSKPWTDYWIEHAKGADARAGDLLTWAREILTLYEGT
jgi:hypothetical protein